MVWKLEDELGEAPRIPLWVRVETVCLPTASEIPLLVDPDLPPRKSVVSQQSRMVYASSP